MLIYQGIEFHAINFQICTESAMDPKIARKIVVLVLFFTNEIQKIEYERIDTNKYSGRVIIKLNKKLINMNVENLLSNQFFLNNVVATNPSKIKADIPKNWNSIGLIHGRVLSNNGTLLFIE